MNTTTTIIIPYFDAAQLEQYEVRIKAGLSSFIEVGEALSAIRDRKLYRATHATFEDYCVERWNMKRNYANKLIESAGVVAALPAPLGTIVTTESQARELASVEPAKRQEVVERAVETTDGKITAAALKQAAQTIEMTPAPARKPTVTITKPSNGSKYAQIAIAQLEKIEPNDKEKAEGITMIRDWCNAALPEANRAGEEADEPRTKKSKSRAARFSNAQTIAADSKVQTEELRDELQGWLDNMPDNLQGGSKAEEIQTAIDELENVIEYLDQVESATVEFPSMFG